MAGVLQFTLGLDAQSFLRGVAAATGGLAGLVGAGAGLRAVVGGVMGAIERGGQLSDLSARTGESAASLYKLQEAFKGVGLSADQVPAMILRMQRGLSGMSQDGERTEKVFAAMGLNMDALRQADAAGQFDAISRALGNMSSSSATGAAATLFGREGAGNMLQIARSAGEFRDVLRASGREAEVFGRYAQRFDGLGDAVGRIKGQIGGMWAGVAGGALPSLEKALARLQEFDWVGLGQQMGKAVHGLAESIATGKFGELFELTLKSAMQNASNFMLEQIFSWSKPAAESLSGKGGGGDFWGKLWAGTKGVGAGLLGLWDEAGAMLGVPGAREWSDKRFDQAYGLFGKAGMGGGVLDSAADALLRGWRGGGNPFEAQLKELWSQLSKDFGKDGAKAAAQATGGGAGLALGQKLAKPENLATEWEKIGLITRGGMAGDYARSTADNTREMLKEQRKTNQLLSRADGGSFDRLPM